ncbi:MAG: hypothetical protein SPL13_02080 [Clostridia bacterium]|nr:hypothetical protein [Clostridia bacterium]
MKCPNCKKTNITVINQPVQLDEKTPSMTMRIITVLSILCLFAGLIFYIYARINFQHDILDSVGIYIAGKYMLKWAAISLVACGIINAIRPHKIENKLIGICLDCGHSDDIKKFKETI